MFAICLNTLGFSVAACRLAHSQDQTVNHKSELARLSFDSPLNLIIVKARINGGFPVNLLIDSGSNSSLVLDNSVAEKLQLKMSDPVRGGKTSQGGKFTMRFVKQLSLEIGGHKTELQRIIVAPCLGHAQTVLGIDVEGIIGQPFLKQVVLAVDYDKGELVLHEPKTFKHVGDGAVLDIEFNPQVGNLPFITASFESSKGTEHQVKLLIDSGGSTSATGGLGLKKDIQAVVPKDAPRIKTIGVTGLADNSEETMHSSFLTRAFRMKLGPYSLERPTLSCGSTHRFNLFGAEVLRRFDVIFDYHRKRLIVNPNESFNAPQTIDKSGILLMAKKNDVKLRRVHFVTPGSPAAEAGLRSGDLVQTINGKPADAQGLIETREMFTVADKDFELEIMRGDKVHTIKLKTRNLY